MSDINIVNNDFAQNLINIVNNYDHHDLYITNRYSGRNMYGKLCFGLVGDINEIDHVLFRALRKTMDNRDFEDYEDLFDEYEDIIERKQIDNMGLKYIIYFPGWRLPKNLNIEE